MWKSRSGALAYPQGRHPELGAHLRDQVIAHLVDDIRRTLSGHRVRAERRVVGPVENHASGPVKLADGTDKAAEVDDLITELRETHRRRPRLQQEFDRARLL